MPDGKTFSGEWSNDKKNGKGEWLFPDGTRREGTFFKDKEDGISIQINTDGTKEKEVWKAGVLKETEKIE